tara:strand:- start:1554 stop:2150 length:597 start_codon:yes stop_codon:yes gene_type:complete
MINKNKKGQLRIQAMKNHRFFKPGCSKKAQLRIQEMAFMLLAVFLFFALVGLFAFTLVYVNISDSASNIAEGRTLSSVTSLADTPEMSCVAAKSNCIDGDKLINLVGKNIYGELWPYSSLRVIKFSGFNKEEGELIVCTKANYPNCDVFNIYDKLVNNERAIATHVALCRKELENGYTYDRCETAKIIAGTKLIQVEG